MFFLLSASVLRCQTALPKPAHIVVVMFENKDYSQIVSSSNAPYINSLLSDTNTAVLAQSYAVTHPSQPNWLMLFSGSDQGVTSDNIANLTPFTTCNLGASLIQSGFTFNGYCEDMPSAGYLGDSSGLYYRKHNPWSNWQGTSSNNLAASTNQPFSAFPSNYNLLPDVSFVAPNINNCMHSGTINLGDSWLQSNMGNYVQWARNNNSLLVLTFDEDNGGEGNRILTFFYGPMVKGGIYNDHVDHYDVLRTFEDIYNLPYCANSSSAHTIDYIWKQIIGIEEKASFDRMTIFPNPTSHKVFMKIVSLNATEKISISLEDLCGRTVFCTENTLKPGENLIALNLELQTGTYSVKLASSRTRTIRRLIIE